MRSDNLNERGSFVPLETTLPVTQKDIRVPNLPGAQIGVPVVNSPPPTERNPQSLEEMVQESRGMGQTGS